MILPGIFPYLVTGMVTASGGAWNASIVAEYFHFKGQTLQTIGLGAQISSATDSGNWDLLLLSTIVMAALVVAREPVAVAAAVPAGADALQAGRVSGNCERRVTRLCHVPTSGVVSERCVDDFRRGLTR